MSTLGTDVTARYPNARGTKKLVFRDDATGDLWVADIDNPDEPVHPHPFRTVQQVSSALLRGVYAPPAPEAAPKAEAEGQPAPRVASRTPSAYDGDERS